MSRWLSACFAGLVFLAAIGPDGLASTNVVGLGQTLEVRDGTYFDKVVVENGGVLIMNGGAIGTNPAVFDASVEVKAGGRFVMNNGEIKNFDSYGVAEIYGGYATNSSSWNRGYVKVAGGNLGIQLIHSDGTVDVYYTATNRASWEIDSTVASTSATPVIRILSVSNSLPAREYTRSTLSPLDPNPYGVIYHDQAVLWTPTGSFTSRMDFFMSSNWTGKVIVQPYSTPPVFTSGVQTAVQVDWVGQVGRTYQVQTSTNLTNGAWENLGLPVQAASTANSVYDSVRATQKFYRVVVRQ